MKMVLSKLTCKECDNNIDIPRKRGRQRKMGHVKTMYCYKCRKKTNHTEKAEYK